MRLRDLLDDAGAAAGAAVRHGRAARPGAALGLHDRPARPRALPVRRRAGHQRHALAPRPDDSERFVANITAAGAVGARGRQRRRGHRRADRPGRGLPPARPAAGLGRRTRWRSPRSPSRSSAPVTVSREAELRATLGRQRRLLSAFADGRDLPELTRQLGEETGLVCRVLTPSGRHVVAGDAPLPDADLDRVTRTFLTAERLPAVAAGRGHAPYSVFPAGPSLAHRPSTWFVVGRRHLVAVGAGAGRRGR